MSRVVDDPQFGFDLIKNELEEYVGAKLSEEPRLRKWYAFALSWADRTLAKDYTDDDGNDIAKPVDLIKVAIFEGVLAQLGLGRQARGAIRVRTGQLEEQYAEPVGLSTVSKAAITKSLALERGKKWLA